MDASRFIGLMFLTLSFVLLSHQMASDSDKNAAFVCPLVDNATMVNGKLEHNLVRSVECLNGRRMAGCCVQRFYCDFNSSHIDLSVYGPPGFRMPCSDVCCPQKYIRPIPLPKNSTKDDDDDSSMDASLFDASNAMDYTADSDSDEI